MSYYRIVEDLFKDCLYKNGYNKGAVIITGITKKVYLNPKKLDSNKEQILKIFNELQASTQPLFEFSLLCLKKNGDIWTGLHSVMELLMFMLIGTKTIEYLDKSRSNWRFGVPSFVNLKLMNDAKEQENEI